VGRLFFCRSAGARYCKHSAILRASEAARMTFALTKIQPPRPRAAFVERGPVQARLADALRSRRLVLLCAPAGYGKTTLLAQEVSRLPEGSAVAWVSADAGDDLQRLLECMLAALEPLILRGARRRRPC
jgi:ATP/maltotriose-dependent transcriptional regulator MalT